MIAYIRSLPVAGTPTANPPSGETEAIPRSDVETAYAYLPCSFERALGFLVGMLVELISKGHPAESEAKLLLVDLLRAVRHVIGTLVVSFEQNDGIQKRFPSLSRRGHTIGTLWGGFTESELRMTGRSVGVLRPLSEI